MREFIKGWLVGILSCAILSLTCWYTYHAFLPPPTIDNLELAVSVNAEVNRVVVYTAEPPGKDVWQTPTETWAKQAGDCEDSAILKIAMLEEAGVRREELAFLTVIFDEPDAKGVMQTRYHAVAAIKDVKNNVWIVLDLNNNWLIPLHTYLVIHNAGLLSFHMRHSHNSHPSTRYLSDAYQTKYEAVMKTLDEQ